MKWLWIICPPVHHWQLQPRFVFLNKTSFYLRGLGSASILEDCPGRLKCVCMGKTLAGVNMPNMKKTARARVCDMRRYVLAPGYWLDLPSSLSALCPGGRHISIGGGRAVGT